MLAAALLALLTTASAEQPLYITSLQPVTGTFEPTYRTTWTDKDLRDALTVHLDSKGIETFEVWRDGAFVPSWPKAKGGVPVSRLEREELLAASWALSRDFAAAEQDLLVPTADDRVRAVSVWWDKHRLRVQAGVTREPWSTGPATADERAAAGAELVDGDRTWSSYEVACVRTALARLAPAQREVLGGVPFTRMVQPTPDDLKRLQRAGVSRVASAAGIEAGVLTGFVVYDLASKDGALFVGTPDDPQPACARVALEAFGRAWASLQDPERAAPPAEEGDDDAPHPRPAPTALAGRYLDVQGALEHGGTLAARLSGDNAFAEAFALALLDPEALARVDEDVAAWFAGGAHLAPPAPRAPVEPPTDVQAAASTKLASGKPDMAALDAALVGLAPALARCEADTRGDRLTLPASVSLRVAVAPDGSVQAVDHRDDGRLGGKVDRCVRALLERLHLAPTADGKPANVHVDVTLSAP